MSFIGAGAVSGPTLRERYLRVACFLGCALHRQGPGCENQRSMTDTTASDPTAPDALLHSAFYRFTTVPDPVAAANAVRTLAQGLFGSITVAVEGVNGAVAGPPRVVQAFEQALQGLALLEGALAGMVFKHSACNTPPFARLKVLVKPEIVALALPGGDTLPAPDERDASHLSPAEWRALLAAGDAVLLDNRNHFEFRLGHFKGAADPQVRHFRDLVQHVQQHADSWRAAGRPVAMYCTGGVRCDKTAPWLRSLGLEVLQLDGGILNYCATLPDAHAEWQGECFVFDKRVALDSRLEETPTTAEQVFDPQDPGEAWRLARALRLDVF